MASTIKVDNVQNQPGTNIINKCSTTITIGASSDTIALACGASQTGFGRTGTVDWQTGDIKTAAFIPAVGKGYFVNTTGGTVTVNLPAGSAGDIVGLKDYAGTWDSNAVTLNPNGSEKIGGGSDKDPTLSSEGGAVLLVYVDGTQGWLTTQESVTTSPSGVETFMVATGGTPCTGAIVCTNYRQHTFTGPGTFCVSSIGCAANNAVAYLVVAGGGGGGNSPASNSGSGGGAGGFREGTTSPIVPYTASPLVAATGITVTASPYAISVGAGGAGSTTSIGTQGGPSEFSTIISAGGGRGATGTSPGCVPNRTGGDGGSGGGGAGGRTCNLGGSGDTPNVTPDQGFPGGTSRTTPGPDSSSGAGGGATAIGGQAGAGGIPCVGGGTGGAGATTSIDGTPTAYAGGGGGAGRPGAGGAGGTGGGGAGKGLSPPQVSVAGTINTGGGAGGGCYSCSARAGGSGVVIIRYKFQ